MSLHHHRLLRQRDGFLSGSVVESVPTPTASFLAQNTLSAPNLSSPPTGIPLVPSSASSSSTAPTESSTSAATNSSASSGNQISLGTVIGACVAALIALVLAVLLAFYCSRRQKKIAAYSKSRNVANNMSRRRSHLEPWKRMSDGADRPEGQAPSMKQRPPSGTLGAMFQRTISNTSGEKSSETYNRESIGTMQHFAKYHPGLAAEMASQGTIKGVDGKVAKPPPVLHLVGRSSDMRPPVSWDGETVGGESFMSLHSSLSNTSPFMMATAKSTPPATTSSLHRWESAEVVHVSQVGSELSEDGELPNPFADRASSIKSSSRGQNPFFSGRDHTIRRTLLAETHKNPFADPDAPRDSSSAAIESLIAALQEPMGQSVNDRIFSVQSSLYSGVTADDGESAISVTAFPYPPTQINTR